MRTLVRSLAAWSCAAALITTIAAPAGAGLPCIPGPLSQIGPGIVLGGWANGGVDAHAAKTVTIYDCLDQPVVGGVVMIDFSGCTSQDIRLCDAQPNHPAGLFNCGQKRVMAITDANGVATFRVAGGATHMGANTPGAGAGCARIYVDGIAAGLLTVGAPDENGIGGVDVADLSAFAADRFGNYRGRSDLNGDNAVTVGDLAVFAAFRFGGGSTASCSFSCP